MPDLSRIRATPWYVYFGTTVWNAGTSPLLVDGFHRSGTELIDAYQYFFDAEGNQVESQQAGTMEWDPRERHRLCTTNNSAPRPSS